MSWTGHGWGSERETRGCHSPQHGVPAALLPSLPCKEERETRRVQQGQSHARIEAPAERCPPGAACAHVPHVQNGSDPVARAEHSVSPLAGLCPTCGQVISTSLTPPGCRASLSPGAHTQCRRELRGAPSGPVLPVCRGPGPPFPVLEQEGQRVRGLHGARSSELPGGQRNTDPAH